MKYQGEVLSELVSSGALRILGRTSKSRPFSFFWTASGIEFAAAAEEVSCELTSSYEDNEIFVDVLIDGARIQRVMLQKGTQTLTLARNLDPSVTRTFSIRRDTQAMPEEDPSILTLESLSVNGRFAPLPKHRWNLEFIGDSITSGEGGCGAVTENEWKSFVFDSYDNYARMTADLLGASYHVLSSSGWGAFCSFDGNQRHALPLYYDAVCGLLAGPENEAAGVGEPWDFAKFRPDAVVVNLGSNDWNAWQGGFLPEEDLLSGFRKSVISFLRDIRAHNETAEIVWALGMLGEGMGEPVRDAIAAYQQETGDNHVTYLSLPNTLEGEYGARQHPGRPSHEKAASVLAKALSRILAGRS
ncbi:MAG: GDSL-type esterase/lipase family protein [Lachnospiraceae bacterium]